MIRDRATEDPREALRDMLAFSARDWAENKTDAWLWGIVFGWDSEEPDEDAMDEVAHKHHWTDTDVARLRKLHENFERLVLPPKIDSEILLTGD